MKSVRIGGYSGPQFPAFELNKEKYIRICSYSVWMRENADHNNSKYEHSENQQKLKQTFQVRWSSHLGYP